MFCQHIALASTCGNWKPLTQADDSMAAAAQRCFATKFCKKTLNGISIRLILEKRIIWTSFFDTNMVCLKVVLIWVLFEWLGIAGTNIVSTETGSARQIRLQLQPPKFRGWETAWQMAGFFLWNQLLTKKGWPWRTKTSWISMTKPRMCWNSQTKDDCNHWDVQIAKTLQASGLKSEEQACEATNWGSFQKNAQSVDLWIKIEANFT